MKKFTTLQHPERERFPEIHLDLEKRLIACNLTALPLLNEWKLERSRQLPDSVLQQYPEIAYSLNHHQDSTCTVRFKGLNISFDIIPFPEAGYIGLYGFHVETVVPEAIHKKIKSYHS